MVTLVKGKIAENIADRAQTRPAVASQPMATKAPTRQEPGLPGLMEWFRSMAMALDAILAGPAMTDQERTRRQLAEVRAETKQSMSLYY